MEEVKRVFFLTDDAVIDELQLKDRFISKQTIKVYPCFELGDGTILYPKSGGPAGFETWFSPLGK